MFNPIKLARAALVAICLMACGKPGLASDEPEVPNEDVVAGDKSSSTADTAPVSGELLSAHDFRDCEFCPQMIKVPGGEALIGGSDRAAHSDGRADPGHTVRIASFAVGRFPVTREQYAHFAQSTGYSRQALSEEHKGCQVYRAGDREWRFVRPEAFQGPNDAAGEGLPANCVNWNDAQAYIRWLNEETGRPYRLLSESEWEYVARAGSDSAHISGECISSEHANFDATLQEEGCDTGDYLGHLTPVARYPANDFGLHDVSGNVWEWVHDCWNPDYQGAPDDGAAWTEGDCNRRVMRGGSWYSPAEDLRLSRRVSNPISYAVQTVGFRVALDSSAAPESSGPGKAQPRAASSERDVEPAVDNPEPAGVSESDDVGSPTQSKAESDSGESDNDIKVEEGNAARKLGTTSTRRHQSDQAGQSPEEADETTDNSKTADEEPPGESTRDNGSDDDGSKSQEGETGGFGNASPLQLRAGVQNLRPRQTSGRARNLLDIDPVFQDTPVWCWLAVGEMIFRYYNVPNANPAGHYQCGVAGLYFGNSCYWNCGNCTVSAQDLRRLDDMIKSYANTVSGYTDLELSLTTRESRAPISEEEVRAQIDRGWPIVIGISPSGYPYHRVSEHVALIIGYTENKLIVNDPFPFQRGQNPYMHSGARRIRTAQYEISYQKLLRRFQWKETIHNIKCRGRHCEGGGPRQLRYGMRCDVRQFTCGVRTLAPLPVGSDCFCFDRWGRQLEGKIVQ